ncbi:protein YIPF6 [Scomber scombrus]|uniref:Protein YIPF6 n=1 Tax=Scomber scombrus TaxID=13677 RepID=A0AAV1PJY9_SCOSC
MAAAQEASRPFAGLSDVSISEDIPVEGDISVPIGSSRRDDEFSTLDEPVKETILRDLRAVGNKFIHVLYPQRSSALLRDWDLWGPLLLCVTLALLLQGGAADSEEQGGPQFAEQQSQSHAEQQRAPQVPIPQQRGAPLRVQHMDELVPHGPQVPQDRLLHRLVQRGELIVPPGGADGDGDVSLHRDVLRDGDIGQSCERPAGLLRCGHGALQSFTGVYRVLPSFTGDPGSLPDTTRPVYGLHNNTETVNVSYSCGISSG